MKEQRTSRLPRHMLNPRINGIRVSVLKDMYRIRLRNHAVPELLAGAGIAVGVALVFGVLVANTSITGSAAALIRAVNGSARLQLVARSSEGFSEQLAQQVIQLPGVQTSAALLREDAVIIGPHGRKSIQLVGLTASIVTLGGSATQNLGAGGGLLQGGLGLPASVAKAVGARSLNNVTILAQGDSHTALVRAVLNSGAIGAIAESPVAVALLPVAQRLAEKPGLVTQVLIQPYAGHDRQVARELRQLARGRATVTSADNELRVLNETAKPLKQSTALFAAISAMVGFLLAINAMLLTLPDRRRLVAELCTQGFDASQIFVILAYQAAVLGIVASLTGLAFGELLAQTFFHQTPVYLAAAFPITIHQTAHPALALLAFAGGICAALTASLPPVVTLIAKGANDASLQGPAQSGQQVSSKATRLFAVVGLTIVACVTLLVFLAPSLTIFGGVLLALAVPCFIPLLFVVATRNLKRIGRHTHGSMLPIASIELNAAATRSIALIGVTALGVYGSVAIQGARRDLTTGLNEAVVEYLDTAAIWVAPNNNFLTIDSFRPEGSAAAIAQAPGVASVRAYQGGLLDIGSRRIWIRARSPSDTRMIQSSQLLQGNVVRATRLIRMGDWAAISNSFASERGLRLGYRFTLPTPTGNAPFRVAAITTNTGWSPGAITINTSDYRRFWHTSNPTAYEVSLLPGISPAQGKRDVESALRDRPGLQVETLAEREASFEASAREGLRSLGTISVLLLITAALAVASVLSAAIWQRRARLSSLKTQGFDDMQLWRALLFESAVSVLIGCVDGAVLGLYGHALASRWLALTTGFPAPFSIGGLQIVIAFAVVTSITLLIIVLPGLSAARVSPRTGFQE
ncbi:MAG TPA: FtsX-like permease family protein [Solirubrobacteraceae bacterium]|jgi:putative ABC transport system permease protein|nr:FtsX-like permease family protein [Solirubrobacteraceae bacterium]